MFQSEVKTMQQNSEKEKAIKSVENLMEDLNPTERLVFMHCYATHLKFGSGKVGQESRRVSEQGRLRGSGKTLNRRVSQTSGIGNLAHPNPTSETGIQHGRLGTLSIKELSRSG